MKNIEEQKKRLEQKKNRIASEELRLKQQERKSRTRKLIELGGLIVKADLDYLDTTTLYGALLTLKSQIDHTTNDNTNNKNKNKNSYEELMTNWTKIGQEAFANEQKLYTPAIVKFDTEPSQEMKKNIRELGMRYNRFRKEWYGNVTDFKALKVIIENSDIKYEIQILDEV